MTGSLVEDLPTRDVVTGPFIRALIDRLEDGKRVRRNLPGGGRFAMDRPLPFLCVYRQPSNRPDTGTSRLVTSEASYLSCTAARRQLPGVRALVRALAASMREQFGTSLVLELWAAPASSQEDSRGEASPVPGFRLFSSQRLMDEGVTESLVQAFGRPLLRGKKAEVTLAVGRRRAPAGLAPLLSPGDEAELGCHLYGLEVSPIYRHPSTGELFPVLLKELRRTLSLALRHLHFEFAVEHTTHRPPHFHALGRRAMVKAVWDSDRQLARVSESFQPLLLVTPVNAESSWHAFERQRFERSPSFTYRPLPADPVVLKRAALQAPVERIEDPAIARLFREKQQELDRQITMIQDRNTKRFIHASIQLYGEVEDSLHDLALEILGEVSPRSREVAGGRPLSAQQFAERARVEIDYLRRSHPQLDARVEIRDDISSLMVSNGNLLISSRAAIPPGRVEALLQHEIGTHVLTYHNGKAQQLRLLATGLAGYDALQEGLAVLSEYLVGGLSRPRMRLLAGRVVAVRCLLDGASFVDTFRVLHDVHGFAQKTAFSITMRVFRGGGLTKDAVYLRGLRRILTYLREGGEIEPLWVGKIATRHIPTIRELQWRGVVRPAVAAPRYAQQPGALARLALLRQGLSVPDLCKRSTS